MGNPYDVVIHRNERYDAARKEWTPDSVFSKPILRAKRRGTASAQSLFGSYYPGAGSVYKVSALRVDSSPNMEFIVHSSQQGTLDVIYGAADNRAPHPALPLYACKGTFKVVSLGTVAQGTYTATFSGVVE